MSLYRAVTSRGLHVACDDGYVQFGYDAKIPLTLRPLYLDAEHQAASGDDWAVCLPGDDHDRHGYLIMRQTREVVALATYRPYGEYSIRVNGVGQIAMIEPAHTTWAIYRGRVLEASGLPVSSPPTSTSQGFNGLTDAGVASFYFGAKDPVIHGYRLARAWNSGDWTGGVTTLDGSDWVVAYHGPSDTLYRVTRHAAPIAPNGRQQPDGSFIVATMFASGGWYPSSGFTVIPNVPLEPIVPTFAKTSQKMGIGLFDDLDGPRIQDYQEVVSANTRAIFWGVGTPGASQSKALAQTLNVEAVAYKDDYGIQPSQVPHGFRALVFAYPKAGMSLSESLNRVDDALDDCTRGGVECDLAVALYCQYKSPGNYALGQQQVLDMLKGVWDLAREYKVGALWGFTKQRFHGGQLVDGVDYWPSLQEAYRRLKCASGDWQHFPLYAEPTPIDPWFPKGRSFLMADVDARGMEVTVGWDPVTHQAIRRFLRVPPGGGDEDIFWDAVAPTPETAVRLRRRGPGECDVLFTLANKELALQPDTRWWQTRPADAVGPFETFRDVAQPPDGLKTIVHVYGQLAVVVL